MKTENDTDTKPKLEADQAH